MEDDIMRIIPIRIHTLSKHRRGALQILYLYMSRFSSLGRLRM